MGGGRVRYLEDFVVGEVDVFESTYTLTEAEIVEVGTRWDPQPFHTDPEAAQASIFGGLVASTVHLFAIQAAIGMAPSSDWETVAAVSALGFDALRLHAPARPGDVLSSRAETIETRLSRSRPGTGVLRVRGELRNQRDELVFSCESACLMQCRP